MGATDSGEPDICSQDNLVAISDVRVCADMLCLLQFSCPENSVQWPVVGEPHWIGLTPVGVVAPVGDAILVTGLSDLVGSSMAVTDIAVGVAVVSSN